MLIPRNSPFVTPWSLYTSTMISYQLRLQGNKTMTSSYTTAIGTKRHPVLLLITFILRYSLLSSAESLCTSRVFQCMLGYFWLFLVFHWTRTWIAGSLLCASVLSILFWTLSLQMVIITRLIGKLSTILSESVQSASVLQALKPAANG